MSTSAVSANVLSTTQSYSGKKAVQSALLASTALALSSGAAYALPTGAQVEAGGIQITQPSATNMVINQSTDKAIINWQGFDIDVNEAARFNQPSTSSVVLNRVNSGQQTQILGNLSANGRVVVVNPNGVFFGAGSRTDVAGLVATTADIKSADFLAGKMNFSQQGNARGSVINQGTITAAEGGLVALVAPSVRNDGVIEAKLGTVALGAAKGFSVDMYGDNLYSFKLTEATNVAGKDQNGADMTNGVENTGRITAQGGTILLTANMAKNIVDQAVNVSGIVEATSATVDQAGTIVLDGGEGAVKVAGTVDASGAKGGKVNVLGGDIHLTETAAVKASGKTQGGNVNIGGGYQGKGELRHASTTKVDKGAKISAASTEGNAGTAVVWSDNTTDFLGDIDVSSKQGNGGLAEVSSKDQLKFQGSVDARGVKNGTLLLDPHNILISNGADNGYNQLNTGNLVTQLGLSNVTISTSPGGAEAGDISLIDDLVWNTNNSLTMIADGNLNIHADVRNTGAADITLTAGGQILAMNPTRLVNLLTNGGDLTLNANKIISATAVDGSTLIGSNTGDTILNAVTSVELVNTGGVGSTARIGSSNGDVIINAPKLIGFATGGNGGTQVFGQNITANLSDSVALHGNSQINAANNLNINNQGTFYSENAGTISSGGTGSLVVHQNNGASIQNAINAIGAVGTGGVTVQLGAGLFEGRVDISRDLTLQGAVDLGGNLLTTIAVDKTYASGDLKMPSYMLNAGKYVPLVYAHDTNNVVIQNLRLDGKGDSIAQPRRVTLVAFDNAGGTATNLELSNFHNAGIDGYDGFGIFADAANADPARTVNITNNVINQDGWGGIFVNGNKLTANISGNTLNLDAFDVDIHQSGILVKRGATANITSNNLSIFGANTNQEARFIDIDGAAANGVVLTDNFIGASSLQKGVHIISTDGVVINNQNVLGSDVAIYIDMASNGTRVNGGTIQGAHVGLASIGNDDTIVDGLSINGGLIGMMLVDNTNAAIQNSSVTNSGTGYLISGGSDNILLGNLAQFITTHGFSAVGTTGITFIGNTANSIGSNGINFEGVTDGFALLNDISLSYGNGIGVEKSDSIEIAANTISDIGVNGINVLGSSNVSIDDNIVDAANGAGIYVEGSDATIIDGNEVTNSGYGFLGVLSSNLEHSNNLYISNGIGAFLAGSDNALLSGDVFENNGFGIVLGNSNNTQIVGADITSPTGGTGILVTDASGNTILRDVILTGGQTGVVIRGAGSSLQFAGNNSRFSNMASYFSLQNGAMVGTTLDASQQFFDGVRAANFTPAQLGAAEGITTDVEDNNTLGDVFYTSFPVPPVVPPTPAPLTVNSQALNQFQRDRSLLFRPGLFSYAGRTVENNLAETPFNFQIASVNLSLLSPASGGQTAGNTVGGNPEQLAGLSTAAGGPGTGNGSGAEQLAEISPAAGGPNCGNSYLDAGYNPAFQTETCGTERIVQ